MSEFTKEELKSLKFHVDNSLAQDDDTEGLMVKLQSMIDGYCNHDQVKVDMGDYYEVYPCKKCWAILHE